MREQQILRKVEQAISAYQMFQPKDKVLAGVSGGPDSVALLHILTRLAPKWKLTIGAAHLDHALRNKESQRDADFTAALCKKLNIPFFKKKANVAAYQEQKKISTEMAGRHIRYAFFKQVAQKEGFNKIALGHHADDNAEVVLINLLRGSGPLGIAGIPPNRDQTVIRPLIYLNRREISFYIKANGLACVLDSSNSDLHFLRNRIRHQLLPFLAEKYNPNITEALNRLALIARTEEDWLDNQTQDHFSRIMQAKGDRIELNCGPLSKLPVALQRRIFRKAIRLAKGNLKRISYGHIDAVCRLLREDAIGKSITLPDGLTARRDKTDLLLFRRIPARSPEKRGRTSSGYPYHYLIHHADSHLRALLVKEAGITINWQRIHADDAKFYVSSGQRTAFFDIKKLAFPLTIRNFQNGDRFRPLGMGGSQKLKKFFIDQKVPRDERRRIPILVSRGNILWVAGYRMSEDAKITEESQNILKMELLLA